jgi:hypothetical protein
MTKKITKKAPKKGLLDMEQDLDEVLKIESGVGLNGITLRGQIWTGTITVKTTLPKSYHRYKIHLSLDEHPYLQRIDDLNKDLDASLFGKERVMRKSTDEKIKEIQNNLAQLRRECEVIEFSATVDALKYSNGMTTLTMRLPDDIVEPFNRQKSRLDLYKVALIPIL